MSTSEDFNDLVSKIQHDINCLKTTNRGAVAASLRKLDQQLSTQSPPAIAHVTVHTELRELLLTLFANGVDTIRELAIKLVAKLIARLGSESESAAEWVTLVVPVVRTRLVPSNPNAQSAEGQEEVKVVLLDLLNKIVAAPKASNAVLTVMPDVVAIVRQCVKDNFDEIKRLTCQLVISLIESSAKMKQGGVTAHSITFIKAITPLLVHKKNTIRLAALQAVRILVLNGGEQCIDPNFENDNEANVSSLLFQHFETMCSDTSSKVREELILTMQRFITHTLYRDSLSPAHAQVQPDNNNENNNNNNDINNNNSSSDVYGNFVVAPTTYAYKVIARPLRVLFVLLADVLPAIQAAAFDTLNNQLNTFVVKHVKDDNLSEYIHYNKADASSVLENSEKLLPKPFTASPGAGIRFLSFACLSHGDTLSPVLAKLTDKWSAPSRKSASFILLYLLVFLQEHLTLYAVKILDSLYRACGEADDLEFSQNLLSVAKLIGAYIPHPAYLDHALTFTRSHTTTHTTTTINTITTVHKPASSFATPSLQSVPAVLEGHTSALTILAALLEGASYRKEEKLQPAHIDTLIKTLSETLDSVLGHAAVTPAAALLIMTDLLTVTHTAITHFQAATVQHERLSFFGFLVKWGAYVPLILHSLTEDETKRMNTKLEQVLSELSEKVQSGPTPQTLYDQYVPFAFGNATTSPEPATRVPAPLALLAPSHYQNWIAESEHAETHTRVPELEIVDLCLAHASSHVIEQYLPGLIPLFVKLCTNKKNMYLKIRGLAMLHRLLQNIEKQSSNQAAATNASKLWRPFLHDCISSIVLPNMRHWTGKHLGAIIRKNANLCLLSLLQIEQNSQFTFGVRESLEAVYKPNLDLYPKAAKDQEVSVLSQAIIALMSAVDDDDIAVRLTACDSWSFLIQWFHARLLDFVTERDTKSPVFTALLKRMDDSEDRVRIHVTAPLLTLVNLAIGPLAKQQQPKHQQLLTDLTKSLLIHLDDHNSAVQDAVFAVLDAIVEYDPRMLAAAVSTVRDTHRNPSYTNRLLDKAAKLQQ